MRRDLFDLLADISDGDFDADIEMIEGALLARRRAVGMEDPAWASALLAKAAPEAVATSVHSVSIGDVGVLKNCRPLYLNGAPFTVKKINRTRAVVNIDKGWLAEHPQATRWTGNVTVPMDMMDFTHASS